MATINAVSDTTDANLLSIDRAAGRLSLSHWTVRAMVRDGRLASCKVGARVLVPESEIQRIVSESMRPAVEKRA